MGILQADPMQTVSIIATLERKVERLEALGKPATTNSHHTLVVFDPVVAVHTIGRMRLLPGTGLKYVPVSWALTSDVNGICIVDFLVGTGYPPVTSACWANKPRLPGGTRVATGLCSGWNNLAWTHGIYVIVNVQSFTTIAQLGVSLELAVQVA
jgi:hypothetical protein